MVFAVKDIDETQAPLLDHLVELSRRAGLARLTGCPACVGRGWRDSVAWRSTWVYDGTTSAEWGAAGDASEAAA